MAGASDPEGHSPGLPGHIHPSWVPHPKTQDLSQGPRKIYGTAMGQITGKSSFVAAAVIFALFCLLMSGFATALPGRQTDPLTGSTATNSLGGTGTKLGDVTSPGGSIVSSASPAAAATLSSEGQSPAAIGLSWTDDTSGTFTNYTVLEATKMSGWAYSTADVITAAGTTTFVASGLSPGTQYNWEVQENYESCALIFCTPETATTNALNLSQPSVAYLNATGVTSTSATLEWTNNATYGTLISFVSYTVWEEFNGGSASELTSITDETERTYSATLLSGDSYSFFVETTDCTGGCGGADPTSSVTQSNLITLGTPLTLSVSLFPDHTTIDLGQSDFFTCTPSGGESPFAYAWDFGNGTYVPGNATESVALASLGLLTVSCKITDSEPEEAAASVSVLVNPPLVVTVTGNRTSADVGQAIAFNCTVANGTAPYSLTWEFGDSATSVQNVTTHAYSAMGNYAPTCVVYDNAGVGRAPSFPIVISPSLEVTATATSFAAAPGTILTFTAEPTNGSGTYTAFSWSFGAGATATGAQVGHAFTSSQDSPITVQVTDSNGATATGSVVVDVSPIVVSASPASTATTTGKAITFKATASGGGGGPYNYTWNFGDGHYGYGATVTHAYSSAAKYTPSLVVKDRLGATNLTMLRTITVASPYAWFTWWVALLIVLAIVAVIAIVLIARHRRKEALQLERTAPPYVPPTDPKQTIFGSKICAFCGSSNLPIRTTCRACGKPLPRNRAS
jgi:PKD domain